MGGLIGWDMKEAITVILDILIIAVLLYYLVLFLKDRRAGKLMIGVGILFVMKLICEEAEMIVVNKILSNVFEYGIIFLVVLFQPEMRAMLEKMGGQSLKSLRSISETKDDTRILHMIDEVVEAVTDMSKTKTGALIAFERTTKLGDIIMTGVTIDANAEAFLIKNIFFNKAPLHDGAMIVRKGRIYAAGCLLPLSVNPDLIRDLGTRHRAGLGMSENSDAIIIIVSEETGTISLACDGKLTRNFTGEDLHDTLEQYLIDHSETGVQKAKRTLKKINSRRTADKNRRDGENG